MSSASVARPSQRTLPVAARRYSHGWRWFAVLVVVLGLHWIAAEWIERHRATFPPEHAAQVPVQVALLKPARIERNPAPAAGHPAPAHRAQAAPRPHVLTAPAPRRAPAVAAPASAPQTASAALATTTPADGPASAAAASATATGAANPTGASGTGEATAAHVSSGVKFSVPPSRDLQYDTFYNGVRNQPGTIHWTSDGQNYEVVVSVPLPFVGTFSYSSHGRVDAFGLAPDQYVEKRGHRGEDVTIFNRSTKQIAFTRTPTSLPLPDGAQDRFSMVMQLASLVRGDPDAYKPGVTRQFFVADNDSGEIWPVETIGEETVRTANGFVGATHFMRLPRHDGDRRRIDVWLAPSLGWLPVRLVQTEPNGTEIELLWRGKLDEPTAGVDSSPAAASSASGAATPGSEAEGGALPASAPPPDSTPVLDDGYGKP